MTEETSPQSAPPENQTSMEGWEDEVAPKRDPLNVVSWSLAGTGIVIILVAAGIRYATHILYIELVAAGFACFTMGRAIFYYRRFRKKQSRQ